MKKYGCYLDMDNGIPHTECVLDSEPDSDGEHLYCVEVEKGITDKTKCSYWRPIPDQKSKVRPTWDQVFMETAHIAAKRSTCLRRSVGAVLVKDNTIISTGYNGAPKGLPHCSETGCLREKESVPSGEKAELCRAIHAEQNAIIQCACSGASCNKAVLYSTTYPCSICAKMIINAGISKVVYDGDYPDTLSKELFKAANIEIQKYKET